MKNYLFAFILSVGLSACGPGAVQTPDSVIAEEQMIVLLVKMHKADAEKQINRLHYPDSTRADTVNYDLLFSEAGVTRAQYDSSMAYYARVPAVLDEIYDEVIERLNKEKLDAETGK
ncbi:MAG: DUF4296 domain-containing protein [Bacteroidia bacterium]|nr:DUF4296 domain-containing protein [Bacteroidia bacterium]